MERCKSLVKNCAPSLGQATAKLNLCFLTEIMKKMIKEVGGSRGDNAAETLMDKALRLLNLQKNISDYSSAY